MAREKKVESMWMKRILAIPAVAALVAFAALSGTAGIASASTMSAHSVAAVAAAHQPAAQPYNSVVFGGYYSTEPACEFSGAAQVGLVLSSGVVYDYDCFFDGEPGPLGPWELWLFTEPLQGTCQPAHATATQSRVAPAKPIC